MAIYILCIIALVVQCHGYTIPQTYSAPASVPQVLSADLDKLLEYKGNIYFHGIQQIFSHCNFSTNVSVPPVKPPVNTEVPDDYVITPEIGAHKLHSTLKTWNQARNICTGEGANLLVITSKEEDQVIKDLLVKNNVTLAWQGIHEQFEKDDWTTVLDISLSAIGYSNWLPGEPNNWAGEHCGTIEIRKGQVGSNDISCTEPKPFICKIGV